MSLNSSSSQFISSSGTWILAISLLLYILQIPASLILLLLLDLLSVLFVFLELWFTSLS